MRRDELYIADLADNARAIREYLDGISRDQWDQDQVRRDAVVYRLLLLGEAASALPDSLRDRYPDVALMDDVSLSFARRTVAASTDMLLSCGNNAAGVNAVRPRSGRALARVTVGTGSFPHAVAPRSRELRRWERELPERAQ